MHQYLAIIFACFELLPPGPILAISLPWIYSIGVGVGSSLGVRTKHRVMGFLGRDASDASLFQSIHAAESGIRPTLGILVLPARRSSARSSGLGLRRSFSRRRRCRFGSVRYHD